MFVAVFILLPLFLVFWSRSHSYKDGHRRRSRRTRRKAKAFKFASLRAGGRRAVLGVLGRRDVALQSSPATPRSTPRCCRRRRTTSRQDIKEVNYSEIPVIDRDSAVLLGNREMGSIPEYVSQFEISPLYSQINYQGSPVRVSPLGYADLFKWFTNREAGIPAYALGEHDDAGCGDRAP